MYKRWFNRVLSLTAYDARNKHDWVPNLPKRYTLNPPKDQQPQVNMETARKHSFMISYIPQVRKRPKVKRPAGFTLRMAKESICYSLRGKGKTLSPQSN